MTISLLSHRSKLLGFILDSTPRHQRCIRINKCHTVLGHIWYIVLAYPVARYLFIQMKSTLKKLGRGHVTSSEIDNESLQEFFWMHSTLYSHSTRLYKLFQLTPPSPSTTTPPYIFPGDTFYQDQRHYHMIPKPNPHLLTPTPEGAHPTNWFVRPISLSTSPQTWCH